MPGSASFCSSSWYSARSVASRCPPLSVLIPDLAFRGSLFDEVFLTKSLWRKSFWQERSRRPHPPREGAVRAPEASLLGGLGLLGRRLRVLLLELRDPARGVEHALLARVERVADGARLHVDRAALGGAAGGEGVAAGAGDLSGHVLRVDVRLHGRGPFDQVVAGSP